MEELTHDEIADVIEMPTQIYYQRVIALFTSGRATEEQWQALDTIFSVDLVRRFRIGLARREDWLGLASVVRHFCMSEQGAQVVSIDRAVLAMGEGVPHE